MRSLVARGLALVVASPCAGFTLACNEESASHPAREQPSDDADAPARRTDAGSVESAPDAQAAAAATPDAGARAPVISQLTVEPNPNNVLSCFVRFETDVPARAEVQFGEGRPEFRVRARELATEHHLLVIGLHPESEYVLRALARNAAGSDSAEDSFQTGSLPAEVPVPELTQSEAGAQPGWTLTNAEIDAGSSGRETTSPAVFLMVDELGIPVWYYVNGTTPDVRGDIAVEVMADGHVMVGPAPGEAAKELDLAGETVWQGPPQSTTSDEPIYHHEAKRLADGSYALLRDGGGVSVEQWSSTGALLSNWRLGDRFAATASGDWCHGNSLTVELEQDVMYVNCRWQGTFKVQRSTGELLWFLSGSLNPETEGDFSFEPAAARFSDAHDPEFHDDGTLLLYDNRYGTGHSRVVEYQLEQEDRVATLLWEFPGDFEVDPWYREDWYSVIWGDADRLENGNVLINAGRRNGDQSRIFEVTRDGEVVWELRFRVGIGTYRAQRVWPLPMIERIEE